MAVALGASPTVGFSGDLGDEARRRYALEREFGDDNARAEASRRRQQLLGGGAASCWHESPARGACRGRDRRGLEP